MDSYKVQGWIKVPVNVMLEAESHEAAEEFAAEAILDLHPRGMSLSKDFGKYSFSDGSEARVRVDVDYELDLYVEDPF